MQMTHRLRLDDFPPVAKMVRRAKDNFPEAIERGEGARLWDSVVALWRQEFPGLRELDYQACFGYLMGTLG